MHYKKLINFISLLVLLLSFSISAHSLLPEKHELFAEMSNAYNALNQKISECKKLESRKLNIDNDWFLSLPDEDKKVLLYTLSRKARNHCAINEEQVYINAIVNYTIVSAVKEPLEEWIALNQVGQSNTDIINVLKRQDQVKLAELSNHPEFNSPFNFDYAIEKYTSKDE